MSYCRFSSDNYRCDFYAYESRHGFELMVAAHRLQWDPPPSPMENLDMPHDQWRELTEAYHEALNKATTIPIKHPAAGSMHIYDTLQELRDRIAELTDQGFHAPPQLLGQLDAEIRDQNTGTATTEDH